MKQNGENYQWEYKCDDDRRNTRKREQQRRGIGVHWTFGFVQRPRFSATAPQYGSEAVGQWAGSRCLSVTTKTAKALTRRVGEKWIGLLSRWGRRGVASLWSWEILEFDPQSHAMHPLNYFYIDGCFLKPELSSYVPVLVWNKISLGLFLQTGHRKCHKHKQKLSL